LRRKSRTSTDTDPGVIGSGAKSLRKKK